MEETIRLAAILALVSALFFYTAFTTPNLTGFLTYSPTGGSAELVIWDETDSYYNGPDTKLTYPTSYAAHKPYCFMGKDYEDPDDYYKWDTHFFANYTDSSDNPIAPASGNCEIRFDQNNDSSYESWTGMTYNATSYLWEYNRSFTYKGILAFQINCSSDSHADFLLTDNVSISNTGDTCIFDTIGGYLPTVTCYEETPCVYDFSQNVSDDDANDVLIYNVISGSFSGFSLDTETGVWTVIINNATSTVERTINLQVNDSDGSTNSVLQNITILPINDPPQFSQLPTSATEDTELNGTSVPESVITATDEEGNTPFKFNLTFVSCLKAHWVENRTANCTLFNFTISEDNITIEPFTPTNWDVGQYQLNFTAEDSGSDYPQFAYNSTNSTVLWFTVENVNDPPNITSWNGTEVNLDQGNLLYLMFNGTDIENDTLLFNITTLYQNLTAFRNTSLFYASTNSTYYPNESAYGYVYNVLTNDHVGNYTLNVSVVDNGTNPSNLTDYLLINVTILNVNDPPFLYNVSTVLPYAVEETDYNYYVNAYDADLETIYGDNLTFGFAFYYCVTPVGVECTIESNSTFSITKVSDDTARLYINAVRNDTGNYTLNLSVADGSGVMNWTLVNVSIAEDDPPLITAISSITVTQNQSYFYHFNITDPQDDTLVITNTTLYRNLTSYPVNLFPVAINSSGYPPVHNLTMNYTPVSNAQVGNYTIEINATDIWNLTTTHLIEITVLNINDPPVISNFTDCDESGTYPVDLPLYENVEYCIKPNDPDQDLHVPDYVYSESLTYSMAYVNCTSSTDYYPSGNCSGTDYISMDPSTGVVNFTAYNETWHGLYYYNLTITDSQSNVTSRLINMTIYPVNDPPVLIGIADEINITAGDNFTYSINATDEENNTPFFYNVSFTCNATPCSLFTIDWYTGEVNFTPDNSQTGNYTANFTVTDAGNATYSYPNSTGWDDTNITVFRLYNAPVIEYLYPASTYVMTEGSQKNFLYKANDTLDNDTLTCYWYVNGTLIVPDTSLSPVTENPVSNCNTTVSSAVWPYTVSYDDALNLSSASVTITLVVMDPQGFTDNASVNMTVLSANRAPRFNQSITSPIQWYNGMSITPLDLDDHFIDDYGEELSYDYIGAANVNIDIDDSIVTLTPVGSWIGTSWVKFVGNDTEYNATSNNVTLIVEYQPPEEVPVPTTKHSVIPKKVSMRIIIEEIVEVVGNRSRASVMLLNDGSYDLEKIRLNVSVNETNITLKLRDDYVESLEVGQNATTWIDITIGELNVNLTYLAHVYADSERPVHSETTTFTIKPIPTNASKVLIEIVMVKDLFEENPECMELFGLILQAEESLRGGDVDEARRLTKLAMDNCQDMIDYSKLTKDEGPDTQGPSLVGNVLLNPFFVMGFVIAILVFAMVGYWIISRRQQVMAIPKTIKK